MKKYLKEVAVGITICDKDGKVLEMNDKSQKIFEKYGGGSLIGKSLFDYHPPMASEKIRSLLATKSTNAYTIEKNGVKKLIYQTPWYEDGECQGLIEFSLELPEVLEHKVRQ